MKFAVLAEDGTLLRMESDEEVLVGFTGRIRITGILNKPGSVMRVFASFTEMTKKEFRAIEPSVMKAVVDVATKNKRYKEKHTKARVSNRITNNMFNRCCAALSY